MSGKRDNERIKSKVRGMRTMFVEEVEPKYVLDLLLQKGIVNMERKEIITSKETKQDRCRALLDFLENCSNDKAFIILKEALQHHYPWIVERIDTLDADNNNENKSNTREEPIKKELDEVNAKLAEAMRELDDLKGELQSTKNELREVKKDLDILKRDRQFQSHYQFCSKKRSLTYAADNSLAINRYFKVNRFSDDEVLRTRSLS